MPVFSTPGMRRFGSALVLLLNILLLGLPTVLPLLMRKRRTTAARRQRLIRAAAPGDTANSEGKP